MIMGYRLVVDIDIDNFDCKLKEHLKSIQNEGLKADVKYSTCFDGKTVVHSALILEKGCDFYESNRS